MTIRKLVIIFVNHLHICIPGNETPERPQKIKRLNEATGNEADEDTPADTPAGEDASESPDSKKIAKKASF